MATQSGEEFGQYLLERLIGHGAMGEVWEATDRIARRTVAIKRLAPHLAENPDIRRRFEREARLAARLRDPHIVPIHRYGEIEGRLYVDMQLVAGMNLQKIIARQGPMRPDRAVAIAAQVAHALTTAHKAGLVHRDVKPSNILLSVGHDGQDLAYLADFGITRNLRAGTESQSSGAMVMGTFDYMAPEQFEGDASPSSDIYSLGCVLFQCLTGSVPYPSGGLPAVMHAHFSAEPPRVSQRAPWVGTVLDGVVVRALSKDPRTRHESAMAFSSAARAAVGAQDFRRTTTSTALLLRRLKRVDRSGDTRPPSRRPGSSSVSGSGQAPAAGAPGPARGADHVSRRPSSPSPAPWSTPGDAAGAWHDVGVSPRRRAVLAGAAVATAVVLLAAIVVAGVSLSRESSADPVLPASIAPSGAPGPSLAQPRTLGIANLPGRPETVAVSPDSTRTYSTTSTGPPALRIVDTATRTELGSIPIPGVPRFVGTAPNGTVYVSFNDDARDQLVVAQIDPVVGAITKLISTGQPLDRKSGQTWLFVFAISPDGRRLYVPHHTRSTVSVLDTDTGAAIAQIAMPNHPHSVALSPDGRTAYVAAHASGEVVVVDVTTNAVTATIPIGAGTSPHDLDVSPDGTLLHVVNYDAGTLTYIDTATREARGTLPVGRNPQSVAFSTDGHRSYVVDNATDTVAVVDSATHQVVGNVRVSVGASMIAVAPDGRRAYVASRNTGVLTTLQAAD